MGLQLKMGSASPPRSLLILTAHVIVSSLLVPPPPPTSEGATFGAETSKFTKSYEFFSDNEVLFFFLTTDAVSFSSTEESQLQ